MRFVVPANLLGLPAISVPVCESEINQSRVLCFFFCLKSTGLDDD